MMKFPFALLLCPVLVIGCKGASPSPTQGKAAADQESKDAEVKKSGTDSATENSGSSLGGDDEAATPPQPVTGAFLTCINPQVKDSDLNIDCLIKDENDKRVKQSDLGATVDYGITSKTTDPGVLVKTIKADASKPFDVRYSVTANDLKKIEKVIKSSTFFVKVLDADKKEMKNAVKPFFGSKLTFPTEEEFKKALGGGSLDSALDMLP